MREREREREREEINMIVQINRLRTRKLQCYRYGFFVGIFDVPESKWKGGEMRN